LTVYKSPSHDEYFKVIDDFYESPDKISLDEIRKQFPFLSQSVTTKNKFKKALGKLSQNNRNTLMESAKHELDKRKSASGIYYQDMADPSATQGRQNYMRQYLENIGKVDLKKVQDARSHLRTRTLNKVTNELDTAQTKSDYDKLKQTLTTGRQQESLKNYTKLMKQEKSINALLNKKPTMKGRPPGSATKGDKKV